MATLQAPRKQESLTAAEWQEILQRLADQIIGWAREEGWTTRITEAQVLEGYPYPPTLEIEAPQGRLKLELPPLSPQEVGWTPRPKLYAWPGLYRVRLKYQGEELGWEIWTDSGIPLHEDWTAKTFVRLAHDLLRDD